MEVYTKKGWVSRDPNRLIDENDICCDCDNSAAVATDAGLDLIWAHCDDCALEFKLGESYRPKIDGIEATDLNTVEIFDLDIKDHVHDWQPCLGGGGNGFYCSDCGETCNG